MNYSGLDKDRLNRIVESLCYRWHYPFARLPGAMMKLNRQGGWVITRSEELFFNTAFGFYGGPKETENSLDRLIPIFRVRKQRLLAQFGAATGTRDLARRLEARGFSLFDQDTGMAVFLDRFQDMGPSDKDLRIYPILDRQGMREPARVCAEAFRFEEESHWAIGWTYSRLGFRGEQGWRFLAVDLGRGPVGLLAWQVVGGAAVIQTVGVSEEARGRGAASALVRQALIEARSLGLGMAVLQASQMGFNVYRRLGFEPLFPVFNYVLEH